MNAVGAIVTDFQPAVPLIGAPDRAHRDAPGEVLFVLRAGTIAAFHNFRIGKDRAAGAVKRAEPVLHAIVDPATVNHHADVADVGDAGAHGTLDEVQLTAVTVGLFARRRLELAD